MAVLHSGLSRGERLDTWNMVQRGERKIVIGPRSAVFAPVGNLGIIVVDEEHDGSYKQGSTPRYNGRDLAVVRGSMEGIPVVLGSASPSAESWKNALDRRYTLVTLPDRATGGELPGITLVNTASSGHSLLSRELLAGWEKNIPGRAVHNTDQQKGSFTCPDVPGLRPCGKVPLLCHLHDLPQAGGNTEVPPLRQVEERQDALSGVFR